MIIVCDLVNEGGASEFKTFDAIQVPRVGEIIIKRLDPKEWGNALKVTKVVHPEGKRPRLHVKFHCGEQHV